MTDRTSLFVFSALAAMAWLVACSTSDAAPSNPITSSQAVTQTPANSPSAAGQVVVENGCVQGECVESGSGYGFLTDNFITRAYHCMAKDFKRNNCWPRPFVLADRQAVRAPFAIMVNKGWQRENTLGEYHFDPITGKLNEPGRLRVHWIVTQEIYGRRSIFIQRSMRPEMTLARVDSVQQWTAQLLPHGDLPPVIETNLPAPGRSAEEVVKIRTQYLDIGANGMRLPRLPGADSRQVKNMDTAKSQP